MAMIQIGVKLPAGWRRDPAWEEAIRDTGGMLERISALGFGYVEYGVGTLDDGGERTLLEKEVRACAASDLRVALHPYFGDQACIAAFDSTSGCRRALGRIVRACEKAAEITAPTVVLNTHLAEAPWDPEKVDPDRFRKELRRQSRLYLDELRRLLDGSGGSVRAVIEHQVPPAPEEHLMRIGDTFLELLRVVEPSDLEVCWDTGHYLLAVERHGQSIDPPGRFLDRVGHVHLHDVVDGADHRPISSSSDRLRSWLERLARAGFHGGITLEYDHRAVANEGGLLAVLEGAMGRLREWGITEGGANVSASSCQ
jgi:sugar phosphate isomerase/epimerase